jgi:hypothetical protein
MLLLLLLLRLVPALLAVVPDEATGIIAGKDGLMGEVGALLEVMILDIPMLTDVDEAVVLKGRLLEATETSA